MLEYLQFNLVILTKLKFNKERKTNNERHSSKALYGQFIWWNSKILGNVARRCLESNQ
jgi:hypothetical protein